MNEVAGHEKRRHKRYYAGAPAWVSWIDEKGRPRHTWGRCLDISVSGAQIRIPSQVVVDRIITVGIPRIKLEAEAVVRSSRQHELKCLLGVEFLSRKSPRPPAPPTTRRPADRWPAKE